MIEIGENLKFPHYTFKEITLSTLNLSGSDESTYEIDFDKIKSIELVGIKNDSEFRGTMEWGMKNPTFILPTTIFYNIINVFKRRNETYVCKIELHDGDQLIISILKNNYLVLLDSIKSVKNA